MIKVNISDSPNVDLVGEKEIKLLQYLGSGAYGCVYLTNLENTVIKIFETNSNPNKINIEYKLFKKLMEYTKNYPPNLVKAIGRGELKQKITFENSSHNYGDKFILIPYYKKFYDVNKSRLKIREKEFVINFIADLLKVSIFLEKKLEHIDLDIKTSNLMYDHNDKLILIDLGLVEKLETGKEIFIPDKKYFIWPYDNCFLVTVPVYSIAICVIEFFFGKLKVWKIQSSQEATVFAENISLTSKTIGSILKKMISLKYDPSTVLKYIELKYKSDIQIKDKDIKLPAEKIDLSEDDDENTKKKYKRKNKRNPANQWFTNLMKDVHKTETNPK